MILLLIKMRRHLLKNISVCKTSGNNPNNISKPLRKGGFVMLKQYKIRVRRRRDGGLFFTIRRDLE